MFRYPDKTEGYVGNKDTGGSTSKGIKPKSKHPSPVGNLLWKNEGVLAKSRQYHALVNLTDLVGVPKHGEQTFRSICACKLGFERDEVNGVGYFHLRDDPCRLGSWRGRYTLIQVLSRSRST